MKWIVLLVMGSIGVGALAGGLIWLGKRYQIIKNGIKVQGIVVDQHEEIHATTTGRAKRFSRTRRYYYPVIEFTTDDGDTVRIEGSSGVAGKPILETGTTVPVIYTPSNPSSAVIGDATQTWLGPVVLSVAGCIFLIFAVGGFTLITKSDLAFQDMNEMMKRDALTMRSDSVRIEATVSEVRQIGGRDSGKYVLVCKGLRPGESFSEEFLSDYFTFKPDSAFIGRSVQVFLDESDRDTYLVSLGPLLKEILQRHDDTLRSGRMSY